MLRGRLSLVYVLVVVLLSQLAWADTEIRNFRFPLPTPSTPIYPIGPIHQLGTDIHQLLLNVSHDQPDVFVRLGFEEGYDAWTIRLSWPGSSPTKFDLDFQPLPPSSTHKRSAILQISARPLSVPIPIYHLQTPFFSHLSSLLHPRRPTSDKVINSSNLKKDVGEWSTSFHIVLEPLIMGAIPQTALPTIFFILIFGIGAGLCVPFIISFLSTIQRESEEISNLKKKNKRKTR